MIGKMEASDNITESTSTNTAAAVTPDIVATVFGAEFLDSDRCLAFVLGAVHKDGPRCPGCGAAVPDRLLRSFFGGGRIRCDSCGKYFGALSGTYLSGTHMSFREIVLLCALIGLGVADKEVARILKISAESVRLWRLKFRAQEEISKGGEIG